MLKSDEYCIRARNGGVVCAGCDVEVALSGLKPLNKKLLNLEMGNLEKAGRVKKCVGCDQLVVVCKNCVDDESSVICTSCIEEVDSGGEIFDFDGDFDFEDEDSDFNFNDEEGEE